MVTQSLRNLGWRLDLGISNHSSNFPILTFIIEVQKFIMKRKKPSISLYEKNEFVVNLMVDLKENLRIALVFLHKHTCTSIKHFIWDYSPATYCIISDASETVAALVVHICIYHFVHLNRENQLD